MGLKAQLTEMTNGNSYKGGTLDGGQHPKI